MEANIKPKRRWRKVLLIIAGVMLFLFLAILCLIPPFIMKDMVDLHVNFSETYEASDFDLTANELSLKTKDGIKIAAYEVYTELPKAVVIFISGIHNPSVTSYFGHAKWLKEHGYASILYELRAHGDSEGNTICLGYKEILDTKAVVDYIKSENKYKDVPIVVFGVSMGGATAINSIGEINEIDGLISCSAYASWDDAFSDNMLNMGAPKAIAFTVQPFVKLYTDFKYGFDTANITPEQEIKKLGDRPALLMHSKDDSQVPYPSFTRIMKNAPPQVETWVRDGDIHFIVKENAFFNPEDDKEYADTIIGFLEKHFGT
ncbi:MAG TPA: alpha/beta fold hydrolase [Mobilitalea sp.]|nr:alpha/beta fold hydrolase [Mobilitalea sp.]